MKTLAVTGLVLASLVVAPAALADSSTILDGYGTSASKPVVQVKGTTGSTAPAETPAPAATPAAASTGPSTLPFTGSDLAFFMVAGAVLVAIGVGLRRFGRDQS
jgi:hypothetical protein